MKYKLTRINDIDNIREFLDSMSEDGWKIHTYNTVFAVGIVHCILWEKWDRVPTIG